MRLPPLSQPDAGWQTWYDAHAARLLLYLRQWLPCRADAEDAVQAGFVKFWKNKPSPDETDVPLLYAAVRCAALDLIKSRTRRVRREEAVLDGASDLWWDADTLQERERAAQLQSAVGRLPADQREVLMLRVWGDMTFAGVAATLNEPLNTVTSRYRYALAHLKKLLPEDCHERIGS